jgi:HemY protein
MIRLITYIALSLAISAGAAWLISLDGTITIDFGNYRMQPALGASILALIALILISIAIWAIIRRIIGAPKRLAKLNAQRRKDKGVQALSDGFIALQGGNAILARKFAIEAKAKLEKNTAAKLLEARADLALGDLGQARENYKSLMSDQKTSLAALTGLHDQAIAQGREDVAISFAKKAHELEPNSQWAKRAVFEDLIKNIQYEKALNMLKGEAVSNVKERIEKNRKQAVLHSAIAIENEIENPDKSLANAQLALKLVVDFTPAALVGARIMSNRNQIRKASSLLRRVFNVNKHPDVATLYMNVQSGNSAVEKLKRAIDLIGENPSDEESAIVLAQAAAEAYEWKKARKVLAGFIDDNPSQGVCVLMAQIEEGQAGDQGKARQWLSKAVIAPRDATWIADGIISNVWEPISPITGKLDAFEWKIPPSAVATIKAEESVVLSDVKESSNTDEEKPLTISS